MYVRGILRWFTPVLPVIAHQTRLRVAVAKVHPIFLILHLTAVALVAAERLGLVPAARAVVALAVLHPVSRIHARRLP